MYFTSFKYIKWMNNLIGRNERGLWAAWRGKFQAWAKCSFHTILFGRVSYQKYAPRLTSDDVLTFWKLLPKPINETPWLATIPVDSITLPIN